MSKKGKFNYFLDHPQIKRFKSLGNFGGLLKLGGSETSAQAGKATQGTKGVKGGTGNMKTNITSLLTKK